MRLRFAVLASVLAALVAVPVAGSSAAPHRGLTINATPNPVNAAGGVLIYRQLNGASSGNQTIRLYHRINPNRQFTLLGKTTTDSLGFYEFPRAEGIVNSNREWFAVGPGGTRSRIYHERVYALVSLSASATNVDTKQTVTFTGHVTPNHIGERVYLQQQRTSSNSDEWHTLGSAVIGPGSNYSITKRWRVPDSYDEPVLFRG